jgi:hypothetical protein
MAFSTQYAPIPNATDVILDLTIYNNDAGTIYDSLSVNANSTLGNVANSIIQNNSTYSTYSASQVFNNWAYQILGTPSSQVCDGWNNPVSDGNNINVNHINGDIGIDYAGWYAAQNNPNQNMMTLRIGVPQSMLDYNHNGQLDANERIGVTGTIAPNAIIATDTDGSHWGGDAYQYGVVPEPGSCALLGLGLIVTALYKKVSKKFSKF